MWSKKPIRVAVLGGGCGAMAAAFGLTSTPELRERYRVVVYQQGWRLGGKGASGRNAGAADRIEEHGLHAFLGFYQNAFRVMRHAIAEWAALRPNAPFRDWTQAFERRNQLTLAEHLPAAEGCGGEGRWVAWNLELPGNEGVPGDAHEPTPSDYLLELLAWMDQRSRAAAPPDSRLPVERRRGHKLRKLLGAPAPPFPADPRGGRHECTHPMLRDAHHLARCVHRRTHHDFPAYRQGLQEILQDFHEWHRSLPDRPPGDEAGRRERMLLDLATAIARGLVADVLPPWKDGFAGINHLELREWLHHHGADQATLDSPVLRALYDLGFSFVDGQSDGWANARIAAGVGLKIALKIALGYEGSVLWKMRSGMGDAIFSPLYEVLRARGVRFEFFHRVLDVGAWGENRTVDRIRLARQVKLESSPDPAAPGFLPADDGYYPLVDVKGAPCWPSEPRWDRIESGVETRARLAKAGVTLESDAWPLEEAVERYELWRDRDFDLVVLGIPVAALPGICPDLIRRRSGPRSSPNWARMLETTRTVRTQGLQLWLSENSRQSGWDRASTILTSFAEPLSTWADMSHLLERESWPAGHQPSAIHYFCGPLADELPNASAATAPPPPPPADPRPRGVAALASARGAGAGEKAQAQAFVRMEAEKWLKANAPGLLPLLVAPPGDARLPDPGAAKTVFSVNASGPTVGTAPPCPTPAGLDGQYWIANIDLSERYVLSVPGSIGERLKAGGSGFSNLALAGDWVATSLNAGCAEAAFEGGLRAAKAFAGARMTFPISGRLEEGGVFWRWLAWISDWLFRDGFATLPGLIWKLARRAV